MARTTRNSNSTYHMNRYYNESEFARTASKMRTWLARLARGRASGVVTADDVHTFLDREGVQPKQVRTRLRFINSVLREPNFFRSSTVASTRPAAKGRSITAWTI